MISEPPTSDPPLEPEPWHQSPSARRFALAAFALMHLGVPEHVAFDLICYAGDHFDDTDFGVEFVILLVHVRCLRELAADDHALIAELERELRRERARNVDPSGRWFG